MAFDSLQHHQKYHHILLFDICYQFIKSLKTNILLTTIPMSLTSSFIAQWIFVQWHAIIKSHLNSGIST